MFIYVFNVLLVKISGQKKITKIKDITILKTLLWLREKNIFTEFRESHYFFPSKSTEFH